MTSNPTSKVVNPMFVLNYRDGHYFLTGSPDIVSLIMQGRHRIFFSFQLNSTPKNNEGWRIPPGDDIYHTFTEITAYLTRHGMRYQLESGAQEINSIIGEQQRVFVEARTNALNTKTTTVPITFQPPNFSDRTLRDHQALSVSHLLSAVNGANFSVPGSGKTTVVYAAYDSLREQGVVDGLLVIGPPSCFMAWTDEYQSCFGQAGSFVRLAGISPEQREIYYNEQAQYEIFLITYQTAYRDVDRIIRLARERNLMAVLDESHYVKKLEGGRYADAVLSISPNAVRRVILTGTPMPNSAKDLWTQITFLWPNEEIFGNTKQFAARQDNLDAIREDINPFFIRINKRALNLPEPHYYYSVIPMAQGQYEIYRALATRTLAQLQYAPPERVELRRWRRGKMIRLLQAASNPTLLTRYSEQFRIPPMDISEVSIVDLINRYPDYEMPSKIQRTIELTRELVDDGRKVLIWTWFVHNIAMLTSELSDLNPLAIHGGIPRDENINVEVNRETIIRTFLSSQDNNILVANPSACAESISLHSACHDAIYLERTFNCGQYLQSLDRIHRIGLDPDQETNYHILISESTIDEVVRDRLQLKEARMREIIDEELPLLSLDAETDDPSDEDIDEDFDHVVESLRRVAEDG